MSTKENDLHLLRDHAAQIWNASVDVVRPQALIHEALTTGDLPELLNAANRIIVVGAGKAGTAMAAAVEQTLPHLLDRITGWVNVPSDSVQPLAKIHCHAARPAGHNFPTADGIAGADQILRLVEQAGADDVVLCLLSGGGSALLPAPVAVISLADKQLVTQLLHASGATINEMNAVRKHLSRIKGGRLAQAFNGRALVSLIISDVIGDPLDVIASGPTSPDPTTFGDALAVLEKYRLTVRVPPAVVAHLQAGGAGKVPETIKCLPDNVINRILANNALALAAAAGKATKLGYVVVNLGSDIAGETRAAAIAQAGMVVNMLHEVQPARPPMCLLSGGETTVALAPGHGLGGRNQEFVLAALLQLGAEDLERVVILSGGTDGEDGPTDAAGAFADAATLQHAISQRLDPAAYLARHDAYHFFEATGDLFKPGLTQTNVMDVRLFLICPPRSQL